MSVNVVSCLIFLLGLLFSSDCSAIQQGGSCYNPDTVRDHASYAFNDYYQRNPIPTSCDFGGTAVVTNVDPSRYFNMSVSINKHKLIRPQHNLSYWINTLWVCSASYKWFHLDVKQHNTSNHCNMSPDVTDHLKHQIDIKDTL
ncbi:hypothetical protein C4D60_Mb04t07590 [Musa balbisiana]|uniref:X8 domain-containing protein n=1 Tax=Musa balbisiana TaxID=52838 RepID=A0A4S8KAA7_MUSBA|nr:hypothetical protein C4D60_Mb04t07590 [Musa balbisiana]